MIEDKCKRAIGKDWLRRILVPTAALVVITLFNGCGIFDVENPETLGPDDLKNTTSLSNSAEGVLGQIYGDAIVNTELVGDQVFHAVSFEFAVPLEQGIFDEPDNLLTSETYNGLVRVPFVADEMISRLQDNVSNPSSHLGIANSHYWAGVAIVMMADYYRELTIKGSAPISPEEGYRRAIERFKTAAEIAAAGGDKNLEAGAYGSIARAYRSLFFESIQSDAGGDISFFQDAESFAAQALNTKPEFKVALDYEQPAGCNPLYDRLVLDRGFRMGVDYVHIKDPVSGESDPRVQHSPLDDISSRGDSMFLQQKFNNCNEDVPVSRANEAILIIAEARLVQGDLEGAVDRINQVRADAGLPDFSSNDAEEIQDQLIYERKVELWLEGRRWQDHRYYEIIPDRWIPRAKQAGVHRRWPISEQEMNSNPNYPGG